MIGGPSVSILLGVAVLGALVVVAEVWSLVIGVALGLPVAGWLFVQLWGELTLEWALRRPLPGGPPPVLAPLQDGNPAIEATLVRPAIEPMRLPPLKFGAFVIDAQPAQSSRPSPDSQKEN